MGARRLREVSRGAVLLAALLCPLSCSPAPQPPMRQPFHAGAFYPDNKQALMGAVSEFLSKAGLAISHVPRAVIVPHAGYQYSGRTAAAGYKALESAGQQIRRVILLAPSHYAPLRGPVINERTYETPLGRYPLDAEAVGKLRAASLPWMPAGIAGEREHADEVQVPFLQAVLPEAKLVPLLIGELDPALMEDLAREIAGICDEQTVLVVSSDFTHYGMRFNYTPPLEGDIKEGIRKLDYDAITFMLHGDAAGFMRYVGQTGVTICGRYPIALLLKVFEAAGWRAKGQVLDYSTSGELTGDFNNSVSYAAIALGNLAGWPEESGAGSLSPEEGKALLKLARHVLTSFVSKGETQFQGYAEKNLDLSGTLGRESGVFVTLKFQGRLRGCIGSIVPRFPLYRGVIDNTLNAAARDPRFDPVAVRELRDISIEISVMSPLIKVSDLEEIEVGRDGLVLAQGPHTGVFLPQVPVEWRWDKVTYLERLGLKAGLDHNAYRHPDTVLHRFTAQVFEEEH